MQWTKLSNVVFAKGMETFSQNPVSIAMKAEGLILYGYLGKSISVGAGLRITHVFKAVWMAPWEPTRPYSAQVLSQRIGRRKF